MRDVTPLWARDETGNPPAVVARGLLAEHLSYLRAMNGAMPDFQVVASTIEHGADGTVTFVMIDVANLSDTDEAMALTAVPMRCQRRRVKSALRHVRDVACAPFN